MLRNLVSNASTGVKDFFGPSVMDGRLNQPRLALATQCYWIQSRIFHVPDRLGFFASGPPRLQVEESIVFVLVVFIISQMVFYGGIAVFLASLTDDRPVMLLAAPFCLLTMAVVGGFWLHLCLSSRRVPGYAWEDWKVHTE